jgi:hypothetical protein
VDLPSTHRGVSTVWAETVQSPAEDRERIEEELLWPKHAIPTKRKFFGVSEEFQLSVLASSVCAT